MYGLTDYSIVQEIGRIMNEGRNEDVEPTLTSLAHKFGHEMLAETARHQASTPARGTNLLHRLGSLLVTLGQKMQANRLEAQATSEDGGYLSLENEARL